MNSDSGYRVAVVGATGAVGTAMRRLLRERNFPASEVVFFASARSVGRELDGQTVQELSAASVQGFDLALFSAGAGTSRQWAPLFARAGAYVIDNSTAWRMHTDVPLVVAEVNPEALTSIPRKIVANPNCTTMTAVLPLKALHDVFGLREFTATSLQAAGGRGQKGMEELASQVQPLLDVWPTLADGHAHARDLVDTPVMFPDVLAFNIVPLLGDLDDVHAYTDEELKLVFESRKILELPDLTVAPTCIRVPVMVGHTIEIRAVFAHALNIEAVMAAFTAFPGLIVTSVPTPLMSAGQEDVAVGRIRLDLANECALNFVVVGDNLLKGAALNAVQLAELLLARGALSH